MCARHYLRCFAGLVLVWWWVIGLVAATPVGVGFLVVGFPEVIAALKPPANGCDPCRGRETVVLCVVFLGFVLVEPLMNADGR